MSNSKQSPKERMVDAARTLFFKHGFQAVTTDMLAKTAKTSKATLYANFADKLALLEAVVEKEGSRFWVSQAEVPSKQDEYVVMLLNYGENFLDLISDSDVRNFERLMIGEANNYPEGASTFYQRAHKNTQRNLARVIQAGLDQGFIKRDYTADELADALSAVWLGMTHAQMQLNISGASYDDIRQNVLKGLDLVLGLKNIDTKVV